MLNLSIIWSQKRPKQGSFENSGELSPYAIAFMQSEQKLILERGGAGKHVSRVCLPDNKIVRFSIHANFELDREGWCTAAAISIHGTVEIELHGRDNSVKRR